MAKYTKEEIREHRIKWIRALESGRYKQVNGGLRIGKKQCCLGVACTVSKLGKWLPATFGNEKWFYEVPVTRPAYHHIKSEKEALLLPNSLSDWLGVRSNDPWLGAMKASQHNDQAKHSFKEIAAAARRQWGLVGA